MTSKNDQSVDSVFGQTPAFSLTDSAVNPAVIQYLAGVRQEALRTNVIKTSRAKRHTADIYDDDEVVVKRSKPPKDLPADLQFIDSHLIDAVNWFKTVKSSVLESKTIRQNHTEESLNQLLYFLRQYLNDKSKDGQVSHLLEVLKDLSPVEENEDYELDEDWAESVAKKLRNSEIKSIADIKLAIQETNTSKPVGFKQWYMYLQQTEPSQSSFSTTIDGRNIWVLVQYMTQEWIKTISKGKRPAQTSRFSNWLLYILFNIPEQLTADYTSNLRNLGKKCRRAIKDSQKSDEIGLTERKTPSIKSVYPRELADLNLPMPPEDLNIIHLTLSVITVIYGQRDLIDWAINDDLL